jgi:chromosome segregation ATPase
MMARAGVYFSDVKRARDEVLAQGRHPSIDAVRAALGNTGSKTTIHKYLREIEAGEGGEKQAVGDAILALAAQLAEQLKREATAELDELRARVAEQRAADERARLELETQLGEVRRACDEVAQRLESREQDLAALHSQLGDEKIARHTAEQRVLDLNVRLADAQRHQASLEEKHTHARDALEHYRTAAREQREQEQRRHEHQVQGLQAELRQAQRALSLKQDELTRLNKEAAALASELGGSRQALHLEREAGRNLAKKIERLQAVEAHVAVLEAQLADSRMRMAEAEQTAARANSACDDLRQQKSALEVELSRAKSAIALEERLARLDKAVFGGDAGSGPEVQAGTE